MNIFDTVSSTVLYVFVIYSQVYFTDTTILHTDNTTWFRSINKRTFPDLGLESFNFSVRSCHHIKIFITDNCLTLSHRYVIFIGIKQNQLSKIRMCIPKCNIPLNSKTSTPQILSCDEFRSFWLSWRHGNLTLGSGEGDKEEIINVERTSPMIINYIGIRSLLPADWIISNDVVVNSSSFDEGSSCPFQERSGVADANITMVSERQTSEYPSATNMTTKTPKSNFIYTDTTYVATETSITNRKDDRNAATETRVPTHTDDRNAATETTVHTHTDARNAATETTVPFHTYVRNAATGIPVQNRRNSETETSDQNCTYTDNVVTKPTVQNHGGATDMATERSVTTTSGMTVHTSDIQKITDDFTVTGDTTVSLKCSCSCKYNNLATQNVSVDDLFLKDKLKKLNENIKIHKDKTTAYKLTKMSASDNRKSSAVIGWVGAGITCIPFALAIISDLLSIKSK